MIVDIHFHLGGVDSDGNVHLSDDMRSTALFRELRRFLFLRKGRADNEAALAWSMDVVRGSKEVQAVVGLALDWVYDERGEPDREQTHLWVSNEWVAEQARKMPQKVIFGASVNPNRADGCEALREVHSKGAKLVKLIPSVQNIDLTDTKHRGFFREMVRLGIPLLSHVGFEHTILPFNRERQVLNDPERLEQALEAGVTVIAAHCALPMNDKEDEQMHSYEKLRRLFSRYPENLYADVSAFFTPFAPLRRKLTERVSKHELPHERLIFGSDFPNLPFPLLAGHSGAMAPGDFLDLLVHSNPLDRNVIALRALGFDPCVFTNAATVLNLA